MSTADGSPTSHTSVPPGFPVRCPHCHYDLTGAMTPRCPDCGLDLSAAGLEHLERERVLALKEIRPGMGLLAISAIAWLAMVVFNPYAGWTRLAMVLPLIAGAVFVALGASAARISRRLHGIRRSAALAGIALTAMAIGGLLLLILLLFVVIA